MLTSEEIKSLYEAAIKGKKNAYIYTVIPIGAAVLTKNGNIYYGGNIESVISGLGTCAERLAISKAVSEGETEIKAVAVVSKDGYFPCGACLQYLTQFSTEAEIVAINEQGGVKVKSLSELLPERYISSNKIYGNNN